MTINPKTCTPETILYDARDIMRAGKFRRLPVMAGRTVVGVITDRDIRSFLLPDDVPERLKERMDLLKVRRVKDVMTKDVITVPPDAPLERAAELFSTKKFGGLPVVENGKLVGMISQGDVFEGLLEEIGSRHCSFRFTIEIPRLKTDALSQFLHILGSQRAMILSVLSDLKSARDQKLIQYTIRVARVAPEKLIPYLEKLGVEIIEVVTESPSEEL